jgi:hypothetical protein
MHVCLLCVIIFLVIELNDECAEEGEVFEYQEEEDQGQPTQGKPSTCCISDPIITLCIVLLLSFLMHCFHIAIVPYIAISWRLSSTSRLVIILRDDTL